MEDYDCGFEDGYEAVLWGNEDADPFEYLTNKTPISDGGAYYQGFLEGARQARQACPAN